jgi:hypothetical protein
MRRAAAVVAALVLVAACREPADAERRGDRAYARRDYPAAYTAYAAAADASGGADLVGKLGLAALRTGDAPAAVDAYRRLAAEDPSRTLEAAEGLAAAARVAATGGNGEALDAAVSALRAVAPDRPLGRWVVELARNRRLTDAELTALAPQGVGAASDAAAGDSLVLAWAAALVRAADCEGAGSLYRAAARRAAEPGLAASAISGASACALAAARQALRARDTAAALDALGSVQQWADADRDAADAAALAAELRAAAARLPPMDTTFFMEDR